MSTVAVVPAATVSVLTDVVMLGPAEAASTEMVYVTVDVETDVTVIVKLRVIPEEGSSPKLKLACPLPVETPIGLASSVAVTWDAAARSILPAPLFIGLERVEPLPELRTGR